MFVKAACVVCFPGFRLLRAGEVCEVPWDYLEAAKQLADRGQLEIVESAPVESKVSAAPPALPDEPDRTLHDWATELRRRNRLVIRAAREEEPEPAPAPAGEEVTQTATPVAKRAEIVCKHCGRKYLEHAKKPTDAIDGPACKGLRKLVEAA